MLIKVHWLNSPLIQATLHTHLEEKKKKKINAASHLDETSAVITYYQLNA